MRQLTVQERSLIFSVLAILLVGACVKHCRQGRVATTPLPEVQVPYEGDSAARSAMDDLDKED